MRKRRCHRTTPLGSFPSWVWICVISKMAGSGTLSRAAVGAPALLVPESAATGSRICAAPTGLFASSGLQGRKCNVKGRGWRGRSEVAGKQLGAVPLRTWRQSRKRGSVAVQAVLDAELSEQVSGQGRPLRPLQIALAVGLMVGGEKALGAGISQWQALPAGLRSLPSPTVGMLLLFVALAGTDIKFPKLSKQVMAFFLPATELMQRWMPLFYTPPLVMLPTAVKNMSLGQGGQLLFLVVAAWVVNVVAVGGLASAARKSFNGRLGDAPNMVSTAPFGIWEMLTWAGAGVAGFGLVYAAPAALGNPATTAAPFFVAATVSGFLLGSHLPGPVKRFVHPVLTAAAFTIVAAFFFGVVTEQSVLSVLGLYLTSDVRTPGGGDLLMAFLGPLTVSYSLTLFRQREVLKRHAREILAVVPAAGLFSLLLTGVLGRQLGLDAGLTRSVAARSVAMPFAVPITETLQGNISLALAASIITGLLGANLSKWLLSRLRIDDLIARGLTTACSSHAFGSASVAAGEPDLMPFCAASYILMGGVCSLACTIPAAKNLLFT